MGASHINPWPRGFPIDQLKDNFVNGPLDTTEFGDLPFLSIGIIQSLCNGDPDNDAVFRMTRPDSTKFSFDLSAKSIPLLIPSYAYSLYNAQATKHLYSAFWGLYLPITVPGRVTDIWRSYITQRIMKDIGLHVLYTPPIVQHERSAHDYLSDFVAERDLYDKTTKLLEFLDGWSSNAATLPARIFELWVDLYEHDYLGLHDVKAAGEWMKTLIAIGYDFPSVNSRPVSKILPQSQPALDGQPYRSFPHFNVNKEGKQFAEFQKHGDDGLQEWLSSVDWDARPVSAVVKLILMTMNEWPLLKSWILYHGYLLGFENLYIVDSSTDTRCVSFLRYARDILGVNVLFNNANLNEMSVLMTKIAANISGSSDFIIKMDTDEFLTVYDNSTKAITTSFTEYLSGFAKHENHPLRIRGGDSRIGYKQNSIPMKDVCEKDIHSTPDKFPLFPFKLIGNGIGKGYKAVYDSRQPFVGRRVSLGGHASEGSVGWTNFGIVHFHYRCAEIDAENSKQVIERHNFISITDSIHETKVKLGKMHGCNATEDMCRTCDFKGRFASWHKTSFYLKWLDCKEEAKEEYYRSHEAAEHNYNTPLVDAMKYSHAKFDV